MQWVYAAKNNRELEERYDEWAGEYDRDLREEFHWAAPRATVALFSKYVARGAKILDAGVGTGLVGECLIDAGYDDLHGIDLSGGMLDVARGKGFYRELRQMTLGESLDFADDTFDAVVSVGVFTTGHAPAHAFDELIRITRNGGYIFFSLKTELHEGGSVGTSMASKPPVNGAWRSGRNGTARCPRVTGTSSTRCGSIERSDD